ncbi:MOSC domain-containing protein [Prochlorothrix hollandica]|uniref:MOSC domain-containing protein n=1 Tax=Prochlorothrix hollandica PCC 9006 = CALU 1027 TaxID=317619 RepID=A0A0M2Q0J9_PROHO|nr:MOSC N-terminal beta barrel domain-containing protein [Prochlorothrix hollandica]KKJ00474.1 hypothetical protein PROH_07260 [Prochlorothrix hollandica PCC 9006 = CALU 1027]
MPHLSRILIYPIKSLDPCPVPTATIAPGGSLGGDRRWAMVDGRPSARQTPQSPRSWVNGKREPQIQRLRCRFDGAIAPAGQPQDPDHPPRISVGWDAIDPDLTFDLVAGTSPFSQWLSQGLGYPVSLVENPDQGFPDDPVSPGPTLISAASLDTVAQWFPGQSVAAMRLRFRVNLEIAEVPPFWEDRLFGTEETVVPFQIGAVQVLGVNPCKRCVVPTRDPWTGTVDPDFKAQFKQRRLESLPPWTVADRFRNPYRLSVNTRIPPSEAGKVLSLGDPVML